MGTLLYNCCRRGTTGREVPAQNPKVYHTGNVPHNATGEVGMRQICGLIDPYCLYGTIPYKQ